MDVGAIISQKAMLSRNINSTEKILLGLIGYYEKIGRDFDVDNVQLSKLFDVKREYVSRMLSNLEKEGFIEMELSFAGKRRSIKRIIRTI